MGENLKQQVSNEDRMLLFMFIWKPSTYL